MKPPWKAIAIGSAVLGTVGVVALVRRGGSTAPKRVALIGDSYAVGLGPELEKLLPVFRAEGHQGTRTDQWARHTGCGSCGDWLTAFKPDVVLVSLGENDGATPNPANYQTIVRGLHGIGARVVWLEPPVDSPARSIISSLGVQTIKAPPMSLDGIHPKNYAPWAQKIAEALG